MRWLIIFLSILLVLLQYPLWFSDSSLPDAWHLTSKIEAQRIENQKLEERNRLLQAEVEDLKSGLEVVEEKARTELGLIKKGETYFQVIEGLSDNSGAINNSHTGEKPDE
ncbi:MAG: cell division protein FtsB [Gammaproteobacteria bacterium]|nr:cell division protein FtsB [Gammaproteobacteria bacterium]